MDVFELAACATIVQVAIWLLLVAIKTLIQVRRMVKGEKENPGSPSKDDRV